MDQTRILVIGLDGATLDLIKPWAEAGHLPTMKNLMDNGQHAILNSVQPVISAAAWTTFMTGANPGKHGIYDFMIREQETYRLRPVTRRHIATPTLWQVLSQQGYRVGVINVPMTYPPEPVNGFMITGLGTPNFKTFTHPPELSQTLIDKGYRVNRHQYYAGDRPGEFLQDTFEIIESVTQTALGMMASQPWDLFCVVYRDTDDIPHAFWKDMDASHPQHDPDSEFKDAIRQMYQRLDESIAALLTAAGPDTTVLIVSDHGFGPLYKDVYLNEWLRQQGYLRVKQVASQRQLLSRLGLTRNNVSRVLRSLGLERVERLIKDLLGDRIEWLPKEQWSDFSEGIDWSNTQAYSFGYQGQIYLNLKGREPQGIVEPGERAQKLLDEIEARLSTLVDPADGQPVVDRFYRGAQLFHGSRSLQAPDLVLVMRNLAYITRLGFELSSAPGQIFGESPVRESGGHRLEGTLIAAGPAIAPGGGSQAPAWLGDLAPTILQILTAKIPSWMDGRPLTSWLSEIYQDQPPTYEQVELDDSGPQSSEALSAEDEAELIERLKDLGYLG